MSGATLAQVQECPILPLNKETSNWGRRDGSELRALVVPGVEQGPSTHMVWNFQRFCRPLLASVDTAACGTQTHTYTYIYIYTHMKAEYSYVKEILKERSQKSLHLRDLETIHSFNFL